jgi:uncharacterized protein (DUF58 family)
MSSVSSRFFAYFGFIQLVGIISMVYGPALPVYVVLIVALLSLAYLDWTSLSTKNDLAITIAPLKDAKLGRRCLFHLTAVARSPRLFQQARIRFLTPKLELFHFATEAYVWIPGEPSTNDLSTSAQTRAVGEFHCQIQSSVLRLGYFELRTWPVSLDSRWSLFKRILQVDIEPIELRVMPDEVRITEEAFIELVKTQKLLLQGTRRQMRTRSADQFHSVRNYQYPDPVRFIDQKKTARYGKLMSRTYETFHSHHLVIAFDSGRSMSGEVRSSAKSDYYLSAALALAESAVHQHDQVSLFTFARTCPFVIKASRALAPFRGLYRAAPNFVARDLETDFSLIAAQVDRLSGTRAIVVILTDLSKPSVQASLLAALGPVCRKHLTVVVSLNDPQLDLEPQVLGFKSEIANESLRAREIAKDFKTKYADLLYSYWVHDQHQLFREKLARLGGGSIVINDSDWMSSVIRLYQLLRQSNFA